LANRGDLVLGLYNGASVGSGVTGVTFDLFVDGTDVLSKSFASAAAAKAYFSDTAIDLGSLAGGLLTSNTLVLQALLTVTSTKAGAGFYGDIILGDPSQAATSSLGASATSAKSQLVLPSPVHAAATQNPATEAAPSWSFEHESSAREENAFLAAESAGLHHVPTALGSDWLFH
jgi:hypothetical protein